MTAEREDWAQWKVHPVTVEFKAIALSMLNDERKAIGRGNCLNTESIDNTALAYARSVGMAEGINRVLVLLERITNAAEAGDETGGQ